MVPAGKWGGYRVRRFETRTRLVVGDVDEGDMKKNNSERGSSMIEQAILIAFLSGGLSAVLLVFGIAIAESNCENAFAVLNAHAGWSSGNIRYNQGLSRCEYKLINTWVPF